MSHDRRRFLGWLGGAPFLGAAAVPFLPGRPLARRSAREVPPLVPITETWDVSWVDRVKGDHRVVFDSPELADGSALVRAVAWCEHYKEVYGVERDRMSPVLVLRHSAIDFVVNDDYWRRFKLGKEHKMKGGDGKWADANPITRKPVPSGATPKPNADRYTLERFIESGGIVLACGWAFRFVASRIGKAEKLENAAATARAKEYLVPGVIIQPNGIFAVIRAQEAGCHFVAAS